MAMVGKRFQRTVSMSQMGPGSISHTEKGQVQQLNGEQQHAEYQPAEQWELLKNAEVIMKMMASAGGANATATAGRKHDVGTPCSPTPSPSGLALPGEQLIGSPSTSLILSSQYFLDACFFCKRRLRAERDIFIYRGDAAFCTEECRDRQILIDQMGSSRSSKKGGDAFLQMALVA